MREAPSCARCPVRERGLFGCLASVRRDRLRADLAARSYEPGQPIFYEDAPALAVYCVSEGEVKLWRAGMHGEVQVVGTRRGGDLLGCRAVLAGGNYTSTADPLRHTRVCALPRAVFLDLVREEPGLSFTLLQRMAALTIESEEQLVARSMESVRQRTARYLLRQLPEGGAAAAAPGPVELHDLLSRVEMADLIGTTPETLSRTLAAWVARGIVTLGRGSIELRDLEALRRIAH